MLGRIVIVGSLFMAAALVGGQSFAQSPEATSADEAAERALVESAIKEMLVDPDSARFEIKPFKVGSGLVCGRFNSKNRMGGYTGYSPFEVQVTVNARGAISSVKLPVHYGWGDEETSAIVAAGHCQKAGYDIPDPRGPGFN